MKLGQARRSAGKRKQGHEQNESITNSFCASLRNLGEKNSQTDESRNELKLRFGSIVVGQTGEVMMHLVSSGSLWSNRNID